jgi:molecular chaperone DnaJ
MRPAATASAARDEQTRSARDYYEVLGVAPTADAETIRQAYHRRARDLHPDVSDLPDAEARFRELTAAYTVLSETRSRSLYDRFGYRGPGNGFTAGAARSSPASVLAEVDVDVFDAARGARREVRYARQEQCEACSGRGYQGGPQKPACGTCAGKGRLTRSASLGLRDWLQVEKCPDCKGAGVPEEDLCAECRGSGSLAREKVVKVRVPAGVEDGTRLRVVGNPEDEHLLVQVRPLPQDSRLVLLAAAALLACSLVLLAYFLNI